MRFLLYLWVWIEDFKLICIDHQIFCPAIDIITCQNEVQRSISADDSPLTEINCIIVPSKILVSSDYSLASDLECLMILKFTIVCLEAVHFSKEIAKKILSVMSLSGKVHKQNTHDFNYKGITGWH